MIELKFWIVSIGIVVLFGILKFILEKISDKFINKIEEMLTQLANITILLTQHTEKLINNEDKITLLSAKIKVLEDDISEIRKEIKTIEIDCAKKGCKDK